jgi:hypothetical protein
LILISLLLAALVFGPAIAPRPATGLTEGYIQAQPLASDTTCKPGHICASYTFNRNGCFFNNYYNGVSGGTPLAIDVTQTGPGGSKTYVYWVNNTDKNIGILGMAKAKYYCPAT